MANERDVVEVDRKVKKSVFGVAEREGERCVDARKRVFFHKRGQFSGRASLSQSEQITLQHAVSAAKWTGVVAGWKRHRQTAPRMIIFVNTRVLNRVDSFGFVLQGVRRAAVAG